MLQEAQYRFYRVSKHPSELYKAGEVLPLSPWNIPCLLVCNFFDMHILNLSLLWVLYLMYCTHVYHVQCTLLVCLFVYNGVYAFVFDGVYVFSVLNFNGV